LSLITHDEFFRAVEEISKKRLSPSQREAVIHQGSPLKIVAGPGSGKTEVLILRALYFMAVKGLPPKSLFLVSFTKKAADELLLRIVSYAGRLKELYPHLSLEPYELYCGTLHSLAARVMDEFQYEPFGRYKLVSEFERELFIYKHFKDILISPKAEPFFSLFKKKDDILPLPLQRRLSITSFLFDFLAQNMISAEKLKASKRLAVKIAGALYDKYLRLIKENSLIDYTLLERMFYKFLKSDEGELFLKGDGTDYFPGISAVLVDEYQDTNLLDSLIYFKLAEGSKNLTVVGDDYQALYRFRGSSVRFFLDFENHCKEKLKAEPRVIELFENYRSDRSIVEYENFFIEEHWSHHEVGKRWRRFSVKKRLKWSSQIDSYPELEGSVFEIKGSDEELAQFVVSLIKELKERGVIEDYSDAVLLLPSTRERDRTGKETFAALIRKELEAQGIGVYNPRSKAFKEREEVYKMVGALSSLLPRPRELPPELSSTLNVWEDGALELPSEVKEALRRELRSGRASILDAFYKIRPYLEPVGEFERFNLGRLSQMLSSLEGLAAKEVESAESLREKASQALGELGLSLSLDGLSQKELKLLTVRLVSFLEFYRSFLPILLDRDVDQEELPQIPPNHFPLMTIHQSKGLEFPIVFVGRLDGASSDVQLSRLEGLLSDYLTYDASDSWGKSAVDAAKKFYVAYSRAIYALFILAGDGLEEDEERPWKTAAFPGFNLKANSKFKRRLKERLGGGFKGDSQ